MDAIPEPFLPNQFDVGLARFIELLGIFHLLRLLTVRTQQVSNLDRTLDILDKYPFVISHKPVYLLLLVGIVNIGERNHEFGKYGESVGHDALE